jgi:hypothetical protein
VLRISRIVAAQIDARRTKMSHLKEGQMHRDVESTKDDPWGHLRKPKTIAAAMVRNESVFTEAQAFLSGVKTPDYTGTTTDRDRLGPAYAKPSGPRPVDATAEENDRIRKGRRDHLNRDAFDYLKRAARNGDKAGTQVRASAIARMTSTWKTHPRPSTSF